MAAAKRKEKLSQDELSYIADEAQFWAREIAENITMDRLLMADLDVIRVASMLSQLAAECDRALGILIAKISHDQGMAKLKGKERS